MRKEYGKALKTGFARLLEERAPEFKEASIRSLYVFPEDRIFRWAPSEPNHAFLILVPHQSGSDEFTVELGWSRLGRFPELSMRPSSQLPDRKAELALPEYVCRLAWLYRKDDPGWFIGKRLGADAFSLEAILEKSKPVSAEDADAAVKPALEDAVGQVLKHGLPYLREWAASTA